MPRNLLVAGATGVVGRAALLHFGSRPDWRIVALSRRTPDVGGNFTHLSLDLRDAATVRGAGAALSVVTHVLFAALHEMSDVVRGWRDIAQMETNLAMLTNLVGALEAAGAPLRHLTLLQGTKAYGAHLHPIRLPARERQPRDAHANFYWLQEDWLRSHQRGKGWSFTILRPQIVVGHALAGALNVLTPLGCYAAILKARGEPLHWPGGAPYVAEAVSAQLLAQAAEWAATSPAAAGETFNIANGDVLVWQDAWPAIAGALGMQAGESRSLRLAEAMPACEAEWAAIVRRHGLRRHTLAELVGPSWQYADFLFAPGRTVSPPPVIVSTIKARQAGFAACDDTEDMFARCFREMQDDRILPR